MPSPKRHPAPPENPAVAARIARRERRRSRSRDEILEGARRVLLRSGIAATTLESVAREIGVSKTALYYYFPSKDALLFELVFSVLEAQAKAVHRAVENTSDGAGALRAIVRETVHSFAPRLDDFRLAFLHGQVASPGSVHLDEQQFTRVRPLNDLVLVGATKKLADERKKRRGGARVRVEPRLLAFLAYLAAIGMLTMKGMVESVEDPLLYSDDQLIDGFARIFEAAAAL
ncbi:MAG: helix-turn-helix domain-containing protein [Burkholderiaceae bacterium]